MITRIVRPLGLALVAALVLAVPAFARRLDVDIWTDRGDDGVYQPGESMKLKVRTTQDAWLLVYEIDADEIGRAHV